jgi:16S rRNA (cytosine1402-N4)-methyltransferase
MNGEGERNGGDDAGIRQPVHVPVLLREVQEVLALEPGQVVVDGTVGAGGHARAFVLAIAPGGTLVGFDRDSEILASAQAVLAQAVADAKAAGAEVGVSLHHSSYTNMHATLVANGHGACDRVLLDLGVSSLQLDRPERGFSFMADGPLDMRMDSSSGPTAAEWLRTVDETELADTLFQLGDERFSRRIARALVAARRRTPLLRTRQLAELIAQAMPAPARRGRIHPATRSFQAIRMAVNDEVGQIERGLAAAWQSLKVGGRLAVISFHSVEDRLVKQFLRAHAELVTRKPIEAGLAEQRETPRARSAKLRCGIKREDAA